MSSSRSTTARARGRWLLLVATLLASTGTAVAQTTGSPFVPRTPPPSPTPSGVTPAPVPAQPSAFPGGAAPVLPPETVLPRTPYDPPQQDFGNEAPTGPVVELSLRELTDRVMAANPSLQSALQARVTASAAVETASAFPNPRLEWSGGRQGALRPDSYPGYVTTYGVSQLIENPSVRNARIEAARSGERGSQFQASMSRNELVAQIRLRAYEYLLRQAEADAAAESLGLLQDIRGRVQARVSSGEAGRYEIIKADAELITARQRRQSALLLAEQAALALNRLAAGRLPARWTLTDARLTDDGPVPNLARLQQQSVASNPELQFLKTEIARADATLDGARASRFPGVDLRYSHARDPEVKQNVVGVSVQIPLFDRRGGPIREASSELVRARDRLEGRQAELQQQLVSAFKALEVARLRADALSQGAVQDSEAALRVAQAAYRFGERGILDVLDAQRVLRSVRSDLLEARYQVQAARIELDYLAGRLIDTANNADERP